MQIKRIFERVSDRLFAVLFADDMPVSSTAGLPNEADELDRNFRLWADGSWLHQFFSQYRVDLARRDHALTVKGAVKETVAEARQFYVDLLALANQSDDAALLSLFKPLDNRELNIEPYELQMLKGKRSRSWLRLYALKYNDAYIITGGAIKLTDNMDRPHLKTELHKLKLVKEYLGKDDSKASFVYLELK